MAPGTTPEQLEQGAANLEQQAASTEASGIPGAAQIAAGMRANATQLRAKAAELRSAQTQTAVFDILGKLVTAGGQVGTSAVEAERARREAKAAGRPLPAPSQPPIIVSGGGGGDMSTVVIAIVGIGVVASVIAIGYLLTRPAPQPAKQAA
jgi:hypothetical protein